MEITIKFGGRRGYSVRALPPGTAWYMRTLDALCGYRGVLSRCLRESSHLRRDSNGRNVFNGAAVLQQEMENRLLQAAGGNANVALQALGSNAYTLNEALVPLLQPIYASISYQMRAINVRKGWNGEGFFTRRFSKAGKPENDPQLQQALVNLAKLETAFAKLEQPLAFTTLLPAPH